MKTILTIILLLAFINAKSQSVGDVFTSKITAPITFERDVDPRAAPVANNVVSLIPYLRYTIVSVNGTDISFQANTLKDDQPSAKAVNYKVYKISKTNYDAIKIDAKGKDILRFGALALPIKLRASDDEVNFETDLNVNFALAVRLNQGFINQWDLTWQVGFGLGSTNLTSSNSSIEEGKDQNVQVLTGLTGLMLDYKGIQLGLYLGIDYINNQKQYNWQYNGNGFASVGIGFNIFGGETNGEEAK